MTKKQYNQTCAACGIEVTNKNLGTENYPNWSHPWTQTPIGLVCDSCLEEMPKADPIGDDYGVEFDEQINLEETTYTGTPEQKKRRGRPSLGTTKKVSMTLEDKYWDTIGNYEEEGYKQSEILRNIVEWAMAAGWSMEQKKPTHDEINTALDKGSKIYMPELKELHIRRRVQFSDRNESLAFFKFTRQAGQDTQWMHVNGTYTVKYQ